MAIIKKTISGLKPGTDYIFALKPKNVEIATSDELPDTLRVSIPAYSGTPGLIQNLEVTSSFEKILIKFDPVSDIDLDYYEYQIYDNNLGTGTPLNARVSLVNSTELVSGFNKANVFVVSVINSTTTSSDGTITSPTNYWVRVRAVNTSKVSSSSWTSLVSSSITPLIPGTVIENLTAAKISAGTINSSEIILNSANSIIRSSNYNSTTGWKIDGLGNATFNTATLRGSIEATSGTIGGWKINPFSISSFNDNVILYYDGTFTIGSNANERATITSTGDFTVVGYDSTAQTYGTTNFYGPWFKIVKSTNMSADVPQTQLTSYNLIIADGKPNPSNNNYENYISVENPSDSESRFVVIKNALTKVYLSETGLYVPDSTQIYMPSATATFSKMSSVISYTNLGGWDGNGTPSVLVDARTSSGSVLLPKTDIWMHYWGPAGGSNNWGYSNLESWTSALISNWDTTVPGYPNPYTIWGITRDGWKAYIYQYYTGNSYSSRTITGASDIRVKDNIQPLNSVVNPLSIVDSIEPKIYDYLHYRTKKLDENGVATDEWNDTPKKFGFIAQDLIETLGEYKDLVTDQVNDPNYDFPIYTTEDRGMIAILWAAVRELSAQVEELKQK